MQRHILLVENDEYNLQKLDEYLTVLGFQVTATRNGQFGLSTLRNQRPDLILLSDTVNDIDVHAFIERKKHILSGNDVPLILLIQGMKIIDVKKFLKLGASGVINRPVLLEKLKKDVFEQLHIPLTPSDDMHLVTEVFIREGIIVVEIGGFLVKEEIVALKYRILDTARTDQTLRKRFYLIIYGLEDDSISQTLFDMLFDFVSHFPRLPQSNVKLLTSDQKVTDAIKRSGVASGFEIVDNYIDGLNKLKALYLENQEGEVLVEFLKPNVALYKNVYERRGILVKEENKSFTAEEIAGLLRKGIKKLYYTRKARVGADKQILESEDVDVVMESINVGGIVVPETLVDPLITRESKGGILAQILIVNGNQEDRSLLEKFFSKKGFTVTVCGSAKDALASAQKSSFDSVIIDLDLDSGKGLDVLKSLKMSPKVKNANYILTGKTVNKESLEQAIRLGIRGFLKSPFNLQKLDQMI
jgi:DNA-binding response OmpR family regulator